MPALVSPTGRCSDSALAPWEQKQKSPYSNTASAYFDVSKQLQPRLLQVIWIAEQRFPFVSTTSARSDVSKRALAAMTAGKHGTGNHGDKGTIGTGNQVSPPCFLGGSIAGTGAHTLR
jgi:hypothetical protein